MDVKSVYFALDVTPISEEAVSVPALYVKLTSTVQYNGHDQRRSISRIHCIYLDNN
jgi:hypothetical protein